MSRAFVKEAEDRVEEPPDRAISQHRNIVTPEGLAAIETALGRFEKAHLEATDPHAAGGPLLAGPARKCGSRAPANESGHGVFRNHGHASP
jgi:hypothetical protein